MNEQEKAKRWHALARRMVRKVNGAWCLEKLTPLVFLVGLAGGVFLVYLRSRVPALPTVQGWDTAVSLVALQNPALWISVAIALAVATVAAWLMARRHFIRPEAALVRLEDRLRLRNALTTAERGVGAWPEPPDGPAPGRDGWTWNWPRVLTPFLGFLGMILSAALVPIGGVLAEKSPASEPLAWGQMEEWLETLEEENLIDETKLEEVLEKIEELRARPEDEWFSHSSLEAGDTLRQNLQRQIQDLGAELANAERDLNALENYGDQLSAEAREKLLAEYEKALQNLAIAGLPLNPELMKSLKGLDPKQLAQGQMSQLTKEQMEQLRQALQKGAGACKKCNGLGDKGELGKLGEGDEALMALLHGLGQCDKPGRGAITRGPGEAPLFLGDKNDLDTQNIQNVENPDFSRAAPGDVLGVGQTEHELDRTRVGPRDAGAVKSVGQGGEAVWRESLTPGERAVLKRYFK